MRERRKSLGITQASLAARLGISASYLNLIEANRRTIGGALLKRVADALDVPIGELDGAAQRRLAEDLSLVEADPVLAELGLAPGSSTGLLSSQHAAWARALVSLHRAYLDRDAAVLALSDRLNQDPVLGETVHTMLTHVTAIRSASEILEADTGLDPRERSRFVNIIASDSRRLSDVSQTLTGLFTRSQTMRWPITPSEQVDDFLAMHDNHFPDLELAAEQLRVRVGLDGGNGDAALTGYLAREHGVTLRIVPTARRDAALRAVSHFDPDTRTMALPDVATDPTRRFRLAQLAAALGTPDAIAAQIGDSFAAQQTAARDTAERVLAGYVAGAMLMPYNAFRDTASATRYDIDHLGDTFHVSFEQVCHRLVTLRCPGAEGIRFGFMRADPAGHARKRFALPQLPQPRYGPACPLWAVYEAFRTPGATVRQLADFPGGERYLLVARAIEKRRAGFGMPRHFMSVMLVCHAMDADRMVYGDGLDLSSGAPSTPVGPACRVCTRSNCSYRQEDAIAGAVGTRAGFIG